MAIEFRGEEILYVIEAGVDASGARLLRPFNQTGGSTEISADTIDMESKDKSGADYGKVSQTVSLEGVLTETDETIPFIITAMRTKQPVKIFEVNTRTKEAESGLYTITSFNMEYSNGDFATYSLEGALNGDVAKTTLTTIPGGAEGSYDADLSALIQRVTTLESEYAVTNGEVSALKTKTSSFVDVQEYRHLTKEVADAPGGLDWADAIEAAIADSYHVKMSAGIYYISRTVASTKPNFKLEGTGGVGQSGPLGTGSTQVIVDDGVEGFIFGSDTSTQFQGVTVENIHVKSRGTLGTGGGIRIKRMNNFRLTNVGVSGFKDGYGYFIDGVGPSGSGTVSQYGLIENPQVHNNKIGIDVTFTNGLRIVGGQMDANDNKGEVFVGSTGIRFRSGDTLRVIGTVIQYYDTQIDLQSEQEGCEIIAARCEGFGTAIRVCGAKTTIEGGFYNNHITSGGGGGATGTAIKIEATATGTTIVSPQIGRVATRYEDKGSRTVVLSRDLIKLTDENPININDAVIKWVSAELLELGTSIQIPRHTQIGAKVSDGTLYIGAKDVRGLYRGTGNIFRSQGRIVADGGLGTNDVTPATTLGNVIGKRPIYKPDGTIWGYEPVYDAIT